MEAAQKQHISEQETGRAGRDGGSARCIMYYSYADAQKTRHMLRQSAEQTRSSPAQLQCNLDSLHAMVRRYHVALPCGMPSLDAALLLHACECKRARQKCFPR